MPLRNTENHHDNDLATGAAATWCVRGIGQDLPAAEK